MTRHDAPRLRLFAAACMLAAAAGLGGCARPAQTGAMIGAGVGAVAGQAAGGNARSTVAGAAVGAGIGYAIGSDYEQARRQYEHRHGHHGHDGYEY